MPGRLCGESRSGPEPSKLGRRGDRKVWSRRWWRCLVRPQPRWAT